MGLNHWWLFNLFVLLIDLPLTIIIFIIWIIAPWRSYIFLKFLLIPNNRIPIKYSCRSVLRASKFDTALLAIKAAILDIIALICSILWCIGIIRIFQIINLFKLYVKKDLFWNI